MIRILSQYGREVLFKQAQAYYNFSYRPDFRQRISFLPRVRLFNIKYSYGIPVPSVLNIYCLQLGYLYIPYLGNFIEKYRLYHVQNVSFNESISILYLTLNGNAHNSPRPMLVWSGIYCIISIIISSLQATASLKPGYHHCFFRQHEAPRVSR